MEMWQFLSHSRQKSWAQCTNVKTTAANTWWTSLVDFPDGKASGYNAGDPGSIPGSGRSPGEGNGNSL